jgi:hypothetical protein
LRGIQEWLAKNRVFTQNPVKEMLITVLNSKTEYWKCRRDLFEFGEGCVFVHGHVRPRSRRSLQVGFENGGTLGNWNLLQQNLFTPPALEDGGSPRSVNVLHPLDIFSQH